MSDKITLPTSPEVREKLEKAGYSLKPKTIGRGEYWQGTYFVLVLDDTEPRLYPAIEDNEAIPLEAIIEVAAILGITTVPGYRLVPEDVAVATARFIRLWTDPSTMALGRPDPATVGTLKALATALEGKDESHG